MDNIIKIQKHIDTINKYLNILNEFDINSLEDFEENVHDYLAISMSLFTLLNSCIEIGEEIISLKSFQIPLNYKEIFKILGDEKIIDKKLSKTLSNAMYHRNMIAHQYDEVNISEIYDFYNKKEIFKEFVEKIDEVIKN